MCRAGAWATADTAFLPAIRRSAPRAPPPTRARAPATRYTRSVDLAHQLAAAAAGLLAGLLSGLFGVGGNVVLVPLLGFLLGVSQHEAQGLTLAALLPPLGLPAVWHYRRRGVPLRWPLVGVLTLGFLLLIPVGSVLANRLPEALLRWGFAVLLGWNAWRQWRGRASTDDEGFLETLPTGWVRTALLGGALAGLASGLLGIGGAVVLIPVLTRRLGLHQREAQLTSLVLLLPPLGLPGVLVYAQAQAGLPWAVLGAVAGGFLLGALGGARLAHAVSVRRLQRGFALLMLVAAAALVLRG